MKSRNIFTAIASLITVIIAALTTLVVPASALELNGSPKVAFIYAAAPRDGGWNEALDNARILVESELNVKIATAEGVVEEATQIKDAIDLFVGRGFNVIVGTTYGYSEGMGEIANNYPNVAFVNASGATNNGKNLEGFYARTYQAWYLAGMAAASVSESGKIGILGGFPIGVVNWDINSFTLGAQAINPDIETVVVYTNSWWDPVKEGEVTEAMLDQGVDVIANNLSSAAPFVAAEKRGAKSIGFQLDMSKHAPNGMLTSVMFNWDKHLLPTIANISSGNWKPNEWGAFPGMSDGVVSLSELSELIPNDARNAISAVQAKIMSGDFDPFTGPIKDQNGAIVVAAGETLDDGGLWGMEFLVEGTIGTSN